MTNNERWSDEWEAGWEEQEHRLATIHKLAENGVDGSTICFTEQIEVIEQMVNIIQITTLFIPRIQRPGMVICRIKYGWKPSEQLAESNVDFAVRIIDRWVDQDRLAFSGLQDVAAPKVAMNQ